MNTTTEVEILLIEDNPCDAELTIEALRSRHLANKLVWVRDGAEALDMIFGNGAFAGHALAPFPKVILLDLKLPKVDGLELLRRLKNDHGTMTIPVVVLTSSREDKDIAQSYRLGVNSYIVKPVNFDSFSEAAAHLGLYWVLVNEPMPSGTAPVQP